jgi:predicted dehydrogenase
MVAACETAGVSMMVHENFRFQSPMLEVRHVLADGAIGEATWARISWWTGYDIHAGQPYLARDERFILLDLGVHVLDLARVLLGEVERVHCESQSVGAGLAGVAALLSPGLELRVTSDGRTITRSLRTPLLAWTAEPWHVSQESVLATQRHWVECLRAGRAPEPSGRDNLKTYALAEAAYESAVTHRAVAPAA